MNDERDLPFSDLDLATPDDLGDVVTDLKLAFLVPPDEDTIRCHLAALTTAAGVASTPLRRSRRRRLLVPLGISGGLLLATSGLAAAGVLPAPIQRAVAAVAGPLGVDVPTTGAPERGTSGPDSNRHDGADPTSGASTPPAGPGADDSKPNLPTDPTSPTDPSQPTGSSSEADPGSRAGPNPDVPGQGGTNPGRSDEAPGQQKDPGASESAPGHGGENPGQSGETHGPPSTNPPSTRPTAPSTSPSPTTTLTEPAPHGNGKSSTDSGS